MPIFYDVVFFKPKDVTVRLVGGEYHVIKPAGYTIQALNARPPVDQSAQVAQLEADLATCLAGGPPPPVPAPTIANFTALPTSLPVGGGLVTLDWVSTNAKLVTLAGKPVTPPYTETITSSRDFVLVASGDTAPPFTATAHVDVALAPPAAITVHKVPLNLSRLVAFVTIGYERMQYHVCVTGPNLSMQWFSAAPLAYPKYGILVGDGINPGVERGTYTRVGSETTGWFSLVPGTEPDAPYMLSFVPYDAAGNVVVNPVESYAPRWIWIDRNGTAKNHPMVVFQNGNYDWTHIVEPDAVPNYQWALVPKTALKTREVPLAFTHKPPVDTAINQVVPGRFFGGDAFDTPLDPPALTRINWATCSDPTAANMHRPSITKRGITVTECIQGYLGNHFHAVAPAQPLIDGNRGKCVVASPTALHIGHGGNIYGLDSFSFWRENSAGNLHRFAGLRHTQVPYWEDMQVADPLASPFVEVVGDWDPSIPMSRRFPWESWGLVFDPRTTGIDQSLPLADQPPFGLLPQHAGEGPVAFSTCRFGRILKYQFHKARPMDPPTITEWVTGLGDPWGLAITDDGRLGTCERTSHKISLWSADTSQTSLGDLIKINGVPVGFLEPSMRRWDVPDLAAARALNCLAPEGLGYQDGRWTWGSYGQQEVRRITEATKQVEICCRVPVYHVQSHFIAIALSDGSFGPRGTIFTTTFDNQTKGRPRAWIPKAGTDLDGQVCTHTNMVPWDGGMANEASWWWAAETGAGVIRGPGATAPAIYPTAIAVGNGMLAHGGSGHGLDVFVQNTLGEPAANLAKASNGRNLFESSGDRLIHGNYGFGHVDVPLPWGEHPDKDYHLELAGHTKP